MLEVIPSVKTYMWEYKSGKFSRGKLQSDFDVYNHNTGSYIYLDYFVTQMERCA